MHARVIFLNSCLTGYCCERGEGTAKNEKEAVKYYSAAASQGHVDAQYCLGLCCHHGKGTVVDKVQAVKWYTLAAEQGYVNAQYRLGMLYKQGEGVEVDKEEARRYLTLAASQMVGTYQKYAREELTKL